MDIVDDCANVGTVLGASEQAVLYSQGSDLLNTAGLLSGTSKRVRVRIRYLVLETNPQYTSEEITTSDIDSAIKKRITKLRAVAGVAHSKRDKSVFRDEIVFPLLSEDTVKDLEKVSKHLPVIIETDKWTVDSHGREITFVLDGKTCADIYHLASFADVDVKDWERDRLNSIIVGEATVVFYAKLGFMDIQYNKTRVKRNVVFRLKGPCVWLTEPLSALFVPGETASTETHPSLLNVDRVPAIEENDGDFTERRLFLPGVTPYDARLDDSNFVFWSKCMLSKSSEQSRFDELFSVANTRDEAADRAMLTESSHAIDKNMSEVAARMESAYKKIPEEGATTLEEQRDAFLAERVVSNIPCLITRGNYMNTTKAITDDSVPVSFAFLKTTFRDRNVPTVAYVPDTTSIAPIHASGRYVEMSGLPSFVRSFNETSGGRRAVYGFMPDVDKNTIRAVISASSPKNRFNADLLTSLFFNGNYNGTGEYKAAAASTLLDDISTLMGEFVDFSEEHLAGMAAAVSLSVSETFTPDDILFPSRTTRWNWPVSLASGMYELAINKRISNVATGRQVPHNAGVWASANGAFLGRLLAPLFDRVVSSGAWATYGARKMMDDIVNTLLTKVMDNRNALALDSFSVSVIGKLAITWYVVDNAARNRGVCSLVYDDTSTNNHHVTSIDTRNEFFIEPGMTLANHRMSDIPARLLSITDGTPASVFVESLTSEKEVKNVAFNIITADQFFENSNEVRIVVTEPGDWADTAAADTAAADKTTLVYEAPRILIYDNERVSNPPEGFRSLRDSHFLTSTLVVNTDRKYTENSGNNPAGVTIQRSNETVNHLSSTLPGFPTTTAAAAAAAENPTPVASMYKIGDATFWDPLISQAKLSNASVLKDRPAVSMDKLMLLETGEIVIRPSKTSSSSSSSSLSDKAFTWLWERMPKTSYLPLTDEKKRRIASPYKLSVVGEFIGRFSPGRSARQAPPAITKAASKLPPALHFNEVDAFLKYDFSHVVVTILNRLSVIVNPTESSYIKRISESVASVMSDSFHIALDPYKKTYEITERIQSEVNGLVNAERHQGPAPGERETLSGKRIDAILRQGSSRDGQKLAVRDWGGGDATVNFTGRLLSMVEDQKCSSDRTETAAPASPRIPSVFFSVMSPPRNRLSHGSEQPLSRFNFTQGHFLYVPVNPRHILTDMQWVETLAAVELGTRHMNEAVQQFDKQQSEASTELRDLLNRWSKKIKTTPNILTSGNEPSVALIIQSFDREARHLVSRRDRACTNKRSLRSRGSTVAIEKFGLIAVARSLLDIDFYYKMNNGWPQMDWRGVVETAVGMAIVPLKENISRGILAASRVLVTRQANEALAKADALVERVM